MPKHMLESERAYKNRLVEEAKARNESKPFFWSHEKWVTHLVVQDNKRGCGSIFVMAALLTAGGSLTLAANSPFEEDDDKSLPVLPKQNEKSWVEKSEKRKEQIGINVIR